MKTLAATMLILCAASLTALAASIDGTWISEKEVGDADGKTLYLCAKSGLYRMRLNVEGVRP